MKKKIFLICLALFSLNAYSQNDFREGFVVKQPGDTLFGLINYRGGTSDYTTCLFKESENSTVSTFTPDEISGFGFPKDRLFASKRIGFVTSGSFNNFIEVLVRGYVSLYSYNGIYYIQKGNDQLYELTITRKEIVKDGQKMNIVTNKYLEILTLLLSDCEETKNRIPGTTLNEGPLTRLAELYNICVNSPYVTILDGKPKLKLALGLSSGYTLSTLDVYSRIRSDQVSYVDVPYESSGSVHYGISFNLMFPRFSEKLTFLGELVYFKSSFLSFTSTEYPLAIDNNYVTIGMEQLSLPIGVRYTFFSNKLSPYLNLGLFNTINLNSTNLWHRETKLLTDNSTIVEEGPALKEINNQYGFWAGGGVMLPISKRIAGFVDLRSEFSYGLSPMPDVSTINNFRISVGLKIQ